MRGRARIEIEHHDENSFHTTYRAERYMEYAKEVERQLQRHMQEKDIPWELKTNPGPPKGCSPFWNCKGWFTTTKGEKVRYPRLGSFEVFVVVQPGFAPKTSGLPNVLQVWSKLQSRQWPGPERLASSVAELLSAAVNGQEVGEEIREIKGRVSQGPKVQPPLTSIHPPMFFGLTPRGGTTTPVKVRVAGDRSRSILKNVEKKNRLGRTELHNAVCRGDETCVQQLLRNRAAVDAKDGSGRTPLHLASDAASEVGVKLIELLLEARATTDATDLSGLTPLNLACGSKYAEAVAVLQSAEGSSRVPEGMAEEHLNTQCAELSDYFAKRYLDGELYDGSGYSNSEVGELLTYKYEGSDGDVMVWRHAFDLRAFGLKGEEVLTLYHYTDELAFRNVGNLEQTAAQLFASVKDERAHFGQGLYATQHEPAVWASRLRILLNNYSNGDPFSPTPEEARKRDAEWGNGRKSGHRAAFCIPLIVPRSIAYNIFERYTPDMAVKTVKDSAGQERPIKLGEDYEGKPTHRNRDVWVIRVETDGKVQHAAADADSILDLLQLRLRKLCASAGEDVLMADCMFELARRLYGRARYGEAEKLYRECLRIRRAKKGEDHPDTWTTLNSLAALLQAQGRLAEAEPLYREALEKGKAKQGEDHPETLTFLSNLAVLLGAQGHLSEAEPLFREALEKRKAKLGEDHPDTLLSINNLASVLQDQGHLAEAEPLYREALKKSKAKLGEDHPQTFGSINNLAMVLQAQGHLVEAEPLLREVLEKRKAKLGEDHPETLSSINNLAGVFYDQGHLAEAEPLYREALEKRHLKLGNQHPDTMGIIYGLADLLKSMKKFEEAEELFREELAGCISRHGEHHEETLHSMENLAEFLEERGKVDEAQELLRLAGQTAQ